MKRLFLCLGTILVATVSPAQPSIEQRPGRTFENESPFSWPTTTPREEGLSQEILESAAVLAADHRSDSLLVLHDGKLVLERYWNGKTASDVQQTYSGTKSLYALLVGRAIERGWISGLDQPLRELVPEMPAWQSQLTFRNVLAMESGLENSPEIEGLGRTGRSQLDIALAQRVTSKPFETYHYNNVAYRLTFTALERAAGRSLEDLTVEEAFSPLGFETGYWVRLYAVDADGSDRFTGYQSIRMTPRDYAKSAQVVLDGGLWNGRRFLPKTFIDELVRSPAPAVNPSFGLFLHLGAGDFYRGYAPPERIERKLVPGAPDDTFLMYGSGGQLVTGIPSLRLVIVRTGRDAGTSIYAPDNFFARLIALVAKAVEGPV